MAATDFDFILTRNELIDEAYRKIGVLPDGDHANANQVLTASIKLNLILKELGDDGFLLLAYVFDSITTVVATGTYDLPAASGLSYVEKAFVVVSGKDEPLERGDIREYADIENKAEAGKPSMFFHDVNAGKLIFWPVPDNVWTIKTWGFRKLKDWDSAASTGELAARWQRFLKYSLATELGEDNKIPLKEIEDLRGEAMRAYAKARGKEIDLSCRSSFVDGAF